MADLDVADDARGQDERAAAGGRWWGRARALAGRRFLLAELLALALLVLGLVAVLAWGERMDERVGHATRMLSELEELERAAERLQQQEGLEDGTVVGFERLRGYVRPQSRLLARRDADSLGNAWPDVVLGQRPVVGAESYALLTPVVGEAFWQPFVREGAAAEAEEALIHSGTASELGK